MSRNGLFKVRVSKKTPKLQSILVEPLPAGKEISKQLTDEIDIKEQAEEITANGPTTNEKTKPVEKKNTPIRHHHHGRNRKHQEDNDSHNKIHHGHHTIKTRYGLWLRVPKSNRPFDTLASNIIGK